ncbi:MAG: peptide chain release factor N(5)-glutamine methyltransferase [Bacilli bacterium]
MTIRAVYQVALKQVGVGAIDTFGIHQLLVHHCQRQSVDDLLTHLDEAWSPTPAYVSDFERLKKGEPVAYILGKTMFLGLPLFVNRDVLIPRPETEELVLEALRLFASKKTIHVVDIGTGSGAIALAIKQRQPTWHVVATDISQPALAVAKENAKHLNLALTFVEGNGLDALHQQALSSFDLIISNPPYVASEALLDPLVRQYEPSIALIASPAHRFYALYLSQAKAWLSPNGIIAFEIDPSLVMVLHNLSQTYFPQATLRIKNDMNGKARFAFLYT